LESHGDDYPGTVHGRLTNYYCNDILYGVDGSLFLLDYGVHYMAITNINISIDSELKDKAQLVFEPLGLDLSTAINMLLKKVIHQKTMPYKGYSMSSSVSGNKDRRAAFGCLKGLISVPDDFNEPLDDFKEYMQ